MDDVNKRRRIFHFLFNLEFGAQVINSREIRLHSTFSANWNKRDKVKKTRNHFKSDVFAAVAVAVVDAKAPFYLNHVVNLGRYRKILLSFSFRLKQKLWKGYITCISKEIIN